MREKTEEKLDVETFYKFVIHLVLMKESYDKVKPFLVKQDLDSAITQHKYQYNETLYKYLSNKRLQKKYLEKLDRELKETIASKKRSYDLLTKITYGIMSQANINKDTQLLELLEDVRNIMQDTIKINVIDAPDQTITEIK